MGNDDVHAKNDHGTKKKTPLQLQSLEKFYAEEKYPTQKVMEEYAASLNLTYNQIRIWFVERRRKEKKKIKVRGSSKKSVLGGGRIQVFECSGSKGSEYKTSESSSLHQSEVNTLVKLKHNGSVEPESDQSKDSALSADDRCVRQKHKRAVLRTNENLSSREEIETSISIPEQLYNPEASWMMENLSDALPNYQLVRKKDMHQVLGKQMQNHAVGKTNCAEKKRRVRLQVLFSKDYILTKIFRKDGPPLGVEFDHPPLNALDYRTDSQTLRVCLDSQRIHKRRKVLESPILYPRTLHERIVPGRKYGIGKGLMTVWRATHSKSGKYPTGIDFKDGNEAWTTFKQTLSQASKGSQRRKLAPKQSAFKKKLQQKRKPPVRKRKVPSSKDAERKKPHLTECKLSVHEPGFSGHANMLETLVDDEELELRELQAGPNPLRCSAHLASNGRHGCPFCKDLLARFPPQTVKMKQPFCTRPWDSAPELVKKLFKALQFMYTHSTTLGVCSFMLDEFAQSFHDKDSFLLGQMHVALLKLLLIDVEREMTAGFIPRASKDCRFREFLNFIREQEFDVNFWCQSLNPLTWTEILRQVLVAAGFGPKQNAMRKEIFNKERNRMAKYGLRPRTLKGELFTMLSKQGSKGLKVAELARASEILELDLPNATEDLEQLICLTLSGDITLFEKIAPSAYRLRVDPRIKGKEDSRSDTDDSGSVDDDSGDASTSSSGDDSDDSMMDSVTRERRIVKYKAWRKKAGQKLSEYTEIDESYSGEAWVLGLMEGEYSNLSIEEKLDALIALLDLVGACSIFRTEEPIRTISANPNVLYQASGAKIKKSSVSHRVLPEASREGPVHGAEERSHIPGSFPSDSRAIVSKAFTEQPFGSRGSGTENSEAVEEASQDVHPLRSIYLGSDRRYNSYWLFLGPCTANDPGHRRVYFESSEDGHWEVIDTAQALHALQSALDSRGTREAHLFASLEKREAFLSQAMDEYMTAESSRQTKISDPFDLDTHSGDGSSPISDIDNIQIPAEPTDLCAASGAIALERGRSDEEKKQKWDRLQAFDKWIWDFFYSSLNAVKYGKRSYMESLARCESCHDLYWRDEKHCRICHNTFEIDFDLEEKYAIHVATCREPEDSSEFPKHKVLSSQLQALKAAIHAIEVNMPEVALTGTWTKLAHKLWVKRLRRTSSLPELLQVLSDFVGAINEEWLYECTSVGSSMAVDEIIVYFQTMPQTTSAVALWMVKLDTLIAPYLERVQSERTPTSVPQLKRRRASTR